MKQKHPLGQIEYFIMQKMIKLKLINIKLIQ